MEGLRPIEEQDYYPLSSGQRRMWFLNEMVVNKSAYTVYSCIRMPVIDASLLELSLRELFTRHETLRTRLISVNGSLFQKTDLIPERILNVHEGAGRDWENNIHNLITTPVEMDGQLLSVHLMKADKEFVFLLKAHHIIFDRKSELVFFNELVTIYQALAEGTRPNLAPAKLQYRDYVCWQNGDSESFQRQKDYWQRKFSTLPPALDFGTDFQRSNEVTGNGERITFDIFPFEAQIRNYCKSQRITPFMFIVAVLNALFYKYAGHEDVVIGIPVEGRKLTPLQDQIGLYVNTLPLRTQFSDETSFDALTQGVRKSVLELFENQDYPFDKIIDDLKLERIPGQTPLFNTLIVFQNSSIATADGGVSQETQSIPLNNATSKFDLSFIANQVANGLHISLEYNSDLFSANRINRIAGHFINVVASVLTKPGIKLKAIDLLTERELTQLLNEFNPTPEQVGGMHVCELIERELTSKPNQIGLICDDRQFTNAYILREARKIAAFLSSDVRCKKSELIGLYISRSEKMVIAMLGVWLSGKGYVPIDPDYPEERISYLLSDSNVTVTLASTSLKGSGLHGATVIDIEEILSLSLPGVPMEHAESGAVAYIIYTSGSTGMPKGVHISRENVRQFIHWCAKEFKVESKVIYATSSYCFDLSVFEIFFGLTNHRCVRVLTSASHMPEYLKKETGVMINTVPSIIRYLFSENVDFGGVVAVNMAGENIPESIVSRLQRVGLEIRNLYGPSEDTTYSTCYRFPSSSSEVLIGRPIQNTQVLVLDSNHMLVPIGQYGEVYISSLSLSVGYLNKPELTDKQFIQHPLAKYGKLYRTGDFGCWTNSGNLKLLGRRDNQIKLRGFRIEMDEIQKSLMAFRGVRDAIVDKRTQGDIESLVAFICFDDDLQHISISEIEEHLRRKLPAFMIPTNLVRVDRFPVTPNGKIDRVKLHAMIDESSPRIRQRTLPAGELELELISVIQECLGLKDVSGDDRFFHLGGDSIQAMQIVGRLMQRGYRLVLKDFFIYPHVRELAERIVHMGNVSAVEKVSGRIPLAPIQQWFFNQSFINPNHFNQSVTLKQEERWNVTAVKQALESLLNRHDMLRASFHWRGNVAEQFIQDQASLHFEEIRVTEKNLFEKATSIHRKIDIQNGIMLYAALFRNGDDERLLVTIHHLVVDGVSWRVLLEEFRTFYDNFASNLTNALPPASSSYKQWVEQAKGYMLTEKFLAAKKYWKELENSIQALNLTITENHSLVEASGSIDRDNTLLLLSSANLAFNTASTDLLLTALSKSIFETMNLSREAVLIETHGRDELSTDINVTQTVGWFTSFYPSIIEFNVNKSLAESIISNKENIYKRKGEYLSYGLYKYGAPSNSGMESDVFVPFGFNYLGQFNSGTQVNRFTVSEGEGLTRDPANTFGPPTHINCLVSNGELQVSITSRNWNDDQLLAFMKVYLDNIIEVIRYCTSREQAELTPSDLGYKNLTVEDINSFFD
jgi:amino acid adenylation domain-containing protein/non-ribosomal peptide synthase protein (TIGR01720 family)